MANKKILIADDHSAIRSGVKHILSSNFKDAQFGEALNSSEVLQKVKEDQWDILILDIDMPGKNGLEILKQFKDEGITIPVLVFSMHRENQVALRALKLGAFGYLSKDAAATELTNAISQISRGRKYIPNSVAELLVSQLENPDNKAPHELLSDREYQTLLLIASGKTVSQIANELFLSVPTISTYRARILEKMKMETNAQLTRYALQNNLI